MSSRKFYPLSPAQVWLIDMNFNRARSTMMNISELYRLSSSVDMEFLAEAINETLNAHDIFRCRFEFHHETSEICQTFDGEIKPVAVEKISDEEFEARKKTLREPYKIIGRPLYRIYLFETPTAKYLYLDFYHAIFDSASLKLLFVNEMDLRYRGRKILHAPKSYAQFVLEEAQVSTTERAEGHGYWKKIMAQFDRKKHLPPVDVKGVKAWTLGEYEGTLKNISESFFRASRRNEFVFFLGAAMLTLAKITGAKDSVMSFVHSGRTNISEFRLFGVMIQQIPCAWDFDQNSSVEDFLNALEGQVYTSMNYRRSLDVVYGTDMDCATLIFRKNITRDHINIGNTTAQLIALPESETAAAQNSLDIEVSNNDGGLYDVCISYDAGRFSAQNIKKFAAAFDEVIREMQGDKISVSKILRRQPTS